MEFIEKVILYMQTVPGIYVLLIACFFAFIENIVPPMPSDMVLLFAATFIPLNTIHFIPLLVATTICSTGGFVTMYFIGSGIDRKVLEEGKIKFITKSRLQKVDGWFEKWGYALIIANRFLSGTRAVISFFAGMTHLNFRITTILSAASSLIWNFALIYFGMSFSENWREIYNYIKQYNTIVFIVIAVFVVFFIIRIFYKKRKNAV